MFFQKLIYSKLQKKSSVLVKDTLAKNGLVNNALKMSLFLLFMTSFSFLLVAGTKTLTLGGQNGWGSLQEQKGLAIAPGKYGFDALVLAKNNRTLDVNTDLLLDFDDLRQKKDKTGNYTVVYNALLKAPQAHIGAGSAKASDMGGLVLRGNKNALFGKEGELGSFVIEFWLNPTLSQNGEKVFSWRSSRNVEGDPIYQMITAVFFNNRLEWNFTNLFSGFAANSGEVTLCSYRTIIPNKWSFYQVCYNQDTGLLELKIDGQTEDLKYITINGKQTASSYLSTNATVCPAVLGVSADIEICSHFTGFIDDFRIVKCAIDDLSEDQQVNPFFGYDMYKESFGRYESAPLPVAQGASLYKIDSIYSAPEQTDVLFFVRSGNNHYQWTNSYPQWQPVTPGFDFAALNGKYFQVAIELYTDGAKSKTPCVTQITLCYEEQLPPPAPYGLFATAGSMEVTLSWNYATDENTGGYFVYYGTRPGEYLGKVAVQGASPIDVGNTNKVTLSGLQNGVIYYFSVASYSRYDTTFVGAFSKEVYARPTSRAVAKF